MDQQMQINSIAAETHAIQAIMTNVFYELKLLDPRFEDAIARGFNNAASFVEYVAIKAGRTSPPEHLVKSLRVVEELRATSLGQDKPKHGV
jgi:hypothetical protein